MDWPYPTYGLTAADTSARWIEVWNPRHKPTGDDLVYVCLGHLLPAGGLVFVTSEVRRAGEDSGFASTHSALQFAYSIRSDPSAKYDQAIHAGALKVGEPGWKRSTLIVDGEAIQAWHREFGGHQIWSATVDDADVSVAAIRSNEARSPEITRLVDLEGYASSAPSAVDEFITRTSPK